MRVFKWIPGGFLTLIFFLPYSLKSQHTADSQGLAAKPWVVSLQPLMVIAPPVGGLRMGVERALGRRFAISSEVSYRAINLLGEFLEPGEADHTAGFQIQPEVRWYLPPSGRKKIPWRSSFSLRLGWTRYNTEVRNWNMLTDGSGNSYRKILGYNRIQQNFDLSALWNYRIPFENNGTGFGLELFMGLGIRVKRFDYRDLSPELNSETIRAQDEATMFSFRQNGTYPLIPLGFRLYYLLK